MIQVENLHKRFGNLHAVDGISFSVKKGELFGFLGPNGAGKTTSLSMIAGLLKPDEGTVLIDEMDIWQTPLAVKKIIGLVPQEVSLYEELTARENLHFWGSLYSLSRSDQPKASIPYWIGWGWRTGRTIPWRNSPAG